MLLTTLIYFLPCLVSILWFISFAFKVKTPRQKLFMWMLAAASIYYASYASFISPTADYATMVRIDTVCVPTALALLALMSIYLNMHIRHTLKVIHMLMLAPAIIIGAVVNMLYYMIGFENAERFAAAYDEANGIIPPAFDTELYRLYTLFDVTLFNIIGLILIILILVQAVMLMRKEGYAMGDVFRFLFKGKATKPSRAIALMVIMELLLLIPLVVLGRTYIMHTPILGVVLSILLAVVKHFMCHVEFFSEAREEITLYSLTHVGAGKKEDIKETRDEQPSEVEVAHEVVDEAITEEKEAPKTYSLPPKMERLAEDFRRLMEEEKIYRNDDLTLITLAERLFVGRTTLSMMVQQKYGKPFREVLNDYRVEAAKRYLANNPTATQESVAVACGFKDASALNKKFKEATGMTPLMWVMQNRNSTDFKKQ